MAEVFIFGQLEGAKNFDVKALFCKWKLLTGKRLPEFGDYFDFSFMGTLFC